MGRQIELNLNKGRHGGRRTGAGRKRLHSKGVAHRTREKVSHRTPLHINFKYLTSIRNKFCLRLLKRAILNARKQGLSVLHFSLQHNHVHLIVEAVNNKTLESGMRSLTVTMARGLNQGRVQIGRYHLHVLKTIGEVKNAVRYVLFNEQRHGGRRVDEFSSLLSITGALDLIRKFAKDKKVLLVVEKAEDFNWLSRGESYLFKTGLKASFS